MPVNTFRMWVLGFIFTMIGAGVNNFFSLRQPSVHIVSLVAELLAFPCGVFLAHVLPIYTFNLGPLGKWNLNPDHKFNIKEHCVITIMANVSIAWGTADATSVIQAAQKFYNFELTAGFKIMVVLCCQLLGFGIAGLCRPWVVEPASIIWPGTLSICALLTTLHSRANAVADGWKISRIRFFMVVGVCAFAWYWFPGLIFVALSYFTWVCWIAPKNRIVNHLFGMQTGLGLSPITFDWTQVAYNTNPLLSPSWAALNVFMGFVGGFWIVVPAIYYTNTWWTGYLPLMTADVYDRYGAEYNVSMMINADGTFNETAYQNYSPPFLGASFAFVYGLAFASITAVLVHVFLWHGTNIVEAMKGRTKMDIHARLMQQYKQTPWWLYAGIIVLMTVLAIIMVEIYDTKLPVYGVFLALVIPAIYMIPCCIIQGITNVDAQQLNVLSEFIGGYMFQGKPLANMIFKTLSQDVVQQGIYFAQDMKLGHYLKVSPRLVFAAQASATVSTPKRTTSHTQYETNGNHFQVLGALTQVGVTSWMLGNIDQICTYDQPDLFSCPQGRTYYSSSVIWGLIGPSRLYSAGQIYSGLLHFFWIGALMPIVTWYAWKRTKIDWLRYVIASSVFQL
jgi:OPT family small oligopeptide transporter